MRKLVGDRNLLNATGHVWFSHVTPERPQNKDSHGAEAVKVGPYGYQPCPSRDPARHGHLNGRHARVVFGVLWINNSTAPLRQARHGHFDSYNFVAVICFSV
jgi:hypothetical protein